MFAYAFDVKRLITWSRSRNCFFHNILKTIFMTYTLAQRRIILLLQYLVDENPEGQ
jgi:hypothetical protein